MVGWKSSLRKLTNKAISQELPELKNTKEFGIDQWEVTKNGKRYIFSLQYGKYSAISEFKIIFGEVDADDEYGLTSPSAEETIFYPDWQTTKQVALASDDTKNVKDKTKYLFWKLSGTREWIYCTSEEQLALIEQLVLPKAVDSFKAWLTKK